MQTEKRRIEIKRLLPKIGTFASLMVQFKLKDDRFWEVFRDLVERDLHYLEFRQIVACMEAFVEYRTYLVEKASKIRSIGLETGRTHSGLFLEDGKQSSSDFYIRDIDFGSFCLVILYTKYDSL